MNTRKLPYFIGINQSKLVMSLIIIYGLKRKKKGKYKMDIANKSYELAVRNNLKKMKALILGHLSSPFTSSVCLHQVNTHF